MCNQKIIHLLLGSVLLVLSTNYCLGQTIFEELVMPGKLIDGHADLEKKCSNCHRPFSKQSQTKLCLDCHKKVSDDIAKAFGFHGKNPVIPNAECKQCHTDHIGRGADIVQLDTETFDHKISDFELKGAHKSVACNACHLAKVKFRDAPSNCFKCHRKDEPHKGRLGEKCESCHSENDWKSVKKFNHSDTNFPLVGKHNEVSCNACHTREQYKDLPTKCVACHQLQDVHKGSRGAKCETCHSPKDWKQVTFDHDKNTKFPIRGKHTKVTCIGCHKSNIFEQKLETECVACHALDDPHNGQLGKSCNQCHNEQGWSENVLFDHDLTGFPLIGQHVSVPCEECHISQRFREVSSQCQQCHDEDDYHKGRLGSQCASCHNPNGWAFWIFNHDRQTNFPLTGSHSGLDCHACHQQQNARNIGLRQSCNSCHQKDDVHNGAFGRRCERCHTTEHFSQTRVRR